MGASSRAPILASVVGLALAVVAAVFLALGRDSPRTGGPPAAAEGTEALPNLRGDAALPEDAVRNAVPSPPADAVEPKSDATTFEATAVPGTLIAARLVDAGGRPITGAMEGRLALRPPLVLAAMHFSLDAEGRANFVSLPLTSPFVQTRTAKSDDDGRVVLELAPEDLVTAEGGFVNLRAVAGGYEGKDVRLRPPAPGAVRELGDVVLAPGRTLHGRVVLPKGRDLARARVLLSRGQDPEREDAIRDQQELHGPMNHTVLDQVRIEADGTFAFEGVSTDARTLWAYAPGTTFARADVEAGADDRGGFVLVPVDSGRAGVCTVEGAVVGPDGDAMPRAWVHVLYADEERAGTTVRTDDEGRFRAGLARSGRFTLVALDERYFLGEGRVEAGPCERDVVVRLPDRDRFHARVVDREGRALGGASVEVRDPAGRVKWFYGSEPLERGVFSVSRPPAPFGLRAAAPGYAAALFVLDPATLGEADVVCSLELDATVVGTVTRRGAPVAEALVELLYATRPGRCAATNAASSMDRPFDLTCGGTVGASTRTDAEGRFALSSAGAGWRVVRAEAEGLGAATSERLEVAAHAAPVEVALELPSTGAISGRVVVRPEVTPAGILVGACRGDGAVYTDFTDADGRFRIEGLSPGGWQVRHCPPRAAGLDRGGPTLRIGFVQSFSVRGDPRWDCTVAVGETASFDLDLRDEGAFVLEGRTSLAAASGNAELRRPGVSEGQPLAFASFPKGGAFRCEVSEGGEYVLSIRTSMHGVGEVTIADRVGLQRGDNVWSYEPELGDLVVRLTPGTAEPRSTGLVHVLRDPRGPEVRTRFGFKGAASEEGKRVRVPSGAATLELTGEGADASEPKAVYVPPRGEAEVVFEGAVEANRDGW